MNKKHYAWALIAVVVVFGVASYCSRAKAATPWAKIIDPSRAIDWSQVGIPGGIPNRTNICATPTLTAGVSAAAANTNAINSAIANCNDGGVVSIASGIWYTNGITFNGQSDVSLRGAGPLQTKLNFTAGDRCGGNGGDICMIAMPNHWIGDPAILPGGQDAASWTGGFTQGATVITLDKAPPVNQYIILDQANDKSDTGGVYICTAQCNSTGKTDANGRTINGVLHSQQQVVLVTGVSASGTSYSVTISPGLYANNWRASQNPGAWWPGQVSLDGVENMTLDHTNSGAESGIYFNECDECWVSNVRSIKPVRNHVWFYQSARDEVVNSYFFDSQNEGEESYGTETFATSDDLIQNNIFQRVASPLYVDDAEGAVFGYNYTDQNFYLPAGITVKSLSLSGGIATIHGINYAVDGNPAVPQVGDAVYIGGTTAGGGGFNVQGVPILSVDGLATTGASGSITFPLSGSSLAVTTDTGFATVNSDWMQVSYGEHGTGSEMNLLEGNTVNGLTVDQYWGTAADVTLFRNRSAGWQVGDDLSTVAMQVGAYDRGINIIGNVFGTPGYSTNYQVVPPSKNPCNIGWNNIYVVGLASACGLNTSDPIAASTLYRWGNYDTATRQVQWNASEVPSTSVPFINAQTAPNNHNLPASFYLSSQPAWWTTPWGTPPWPSIGPDVSGGSGPGGYSYPSAAQLCYLHAQVDPNYINGLLAFDASNCYGTSGVNGNPPQIVSALTANGTTTVPFNYQIVASNNPTSYGATGLPGGLTISAASGVISGTPTATGIYSVTLSATNNYGTGTATLVVTIGMPVGQPPSIPQNLMVTGSTSSTILLAWTASNDALGVAGYMIYRCSGTCSPTAANSIGTTTATSYTDTGLAPSSTYTYAVSAYDSAGNTSALSTPVQGMTQGGGDTQAPSVAIIYPPSGSTVSSTVTVVASSSDNVGVSSVGFYLNGTLVQTDAAAPYTWVWNTASSSNGSDALSAKAYDAAGNVGTSPNVAVTVSNPDITPPTTPTNLTVTGSTTSTISLSWNASYDTLGVAGYTVYRCPGVCTPTASNNIGTTVTTSYIDANLTASSTYTYAVSAYDSAGNSSALSTLTQGMTIPSIGLYATIAQTQNVGNNTIGTGRSTVHLQAFFGNPVVQGDTILVWTRWGSISTGTVTDSLGNTYVPVKSQLTSKNTGASAELFMATNVQGGPDAVTLTLGTTSLNLTIHAYEFQGVAGLDAVTSTIDTKTPGTAALTPALTGELAFGGSMSDNGSVTFWSAPSPYRLPRQNSRTATEFAILPTNQSSGGSYTATGGSSFVTEFVLLEPSYLLTYASRSGIGVAASVNNAGLTATMASSAQGLAAELRVLEAELASLKAKAGL